MQLILQQLITGIALLAEWAESARLSHEAQKISGRKRRSSDHALLHYVADLASIYQSVFGKSPVSARNPLPRWKALRK
jgi:hypothetical protein